MWCTSCSDVLGVDVSESSLEEKGHVYIQPLFSDGVKLECLLQNDQTVFIIIISLFLHNEKIKHLLLF